MFRIHFKITFFYALLTLALLIVVYFFVLDYFQKEQYRTIQNDLQKELTVYRSVIQDNTDLSDPEYLDLITAVSDTNFTERVTVIDRTGRVIADSEVPRKLLNTVNNHSNRLEVIEAFKTGFGESRHYSQTINKDMIYRAVLVTNRNQPYVIRLSLPYEKMSSLVGQFNDFILSVLFLILVLSVLIGYFVLKKVTGPLNQMISWAQKIASGDYSEKILHFSEDEVGLLSSALNDMSSEFRVKIDELNFSRLRLERTLMAIIDGILVINQNEQTVLVNDALKNFLSLDDSSLNKKYYEIIRNHNVIELIERTISADRGVQQAEVQLFSDQERIFEVFGIPIFKNRKMDWAVFVFHDITGIKQLENKRKDFVANVSHELKTPISIIKGYSETLLDGALDDKENARKFLKLINDDAGRLSKLVDDLLKLSGIESGQLILELKACPVRELLEQAYIRFKKMADEKNIELGHMIPDGLPKVLADEERIGEVFINLIDNAIKYTPENGKIMVTAEAVGDMVAITITDTGIGIPKDKIPRLFERFYRVDPGRSRKLGSTGLGLSIVKHIVQAHNGSVDVKSSIGEGSSFSFTLPEA